MRFRPLFIIILVLGSAAALLITKVVMLSNSQKQESADPKWRVYSNERYQFEIEYPAEWVYETSSSIRIKTLFRISFKNPANTEDTITKFDVLVEHNESPTLDEWTKANEPKTIRGEGGIKDNTVRDISVSDLPAREFTVYGADYNRVFIVILKGDKAFILGHPTEETMNGVYSQMISSFRFLQ